MDASFFLSVARRLAVRGCFILLSLTAPGIAQQYGYAHSPTLAPAPGGGVEWSASVDCSTVAPAAWIGARVTFAFDADLDGVPEIQDSLSVPAGDCGEEEPGRILLRRRWSSVPPSVLFGSLQTPSEKIVASHAMQTAGIGSLLSLSRFCARPKNGEPEWVEVRNASTHPIGFASSRIRLETRVLPGELYSLLPGEAILAGSDTAELRLWQPDARIVALSSWSSLRNAGDTIRLAVATTDSLHPGLMLDSLVYGAAAHVRENCASQESEGSGAAAAGYAMEIASKRWRYGSEDFVFKVRAPTDGVYDLRVYDTDGLPLCTLARKAVGPAEYRLPQAACVRMNGHAGTFVLLLLPRAAPRVRTVIRTVE
jgi:hypothetical protein